MVTFFYNLFFTGWYWRLFSFFRSLFFRRIETSFFLSLNTKFFFLLIFRWIVYGFFLYLVCNKDCFIFLVMCCMFLWCLVSLMSYLSYIFVVENCLLERVWFCTACIRFIGLRLLWYLVKDFCVIDFSRSSFVKRINYIFIRGFAGVLEGLLLIINIKCFLSFLVIGFRNRWFSVGLFSGRKSSLNIRWTVFGLKYDKFKRVVVVFVFRTLEKRLLFFFFFKMVSVFKNRCVIGVTVLWVNLF